MAGTAAAAMAGGKEGRATDVRVAQGREKGALPMSTAREAPGRTRVRSAVLAGAHLAGSAAGKGALQGEVAEVTMGAAEVLAEGKDSALRPWACP